MNYSEINVGIRRIRYMTFEQEIDKELTRFALWAAENKVDLDENNWIYEDIGNIFGKACRYSIAVTKETWKYDKVVLFVDINNRVHVNHKYEPWVKGKIKQEAN